MHLLVGRLQRGATRRVVDRAARRGVSVQQRIPHNHGVFGLHKLWWKNDDYAFVELSAQLLFWFQADQADGPDLYLEQEKFQADQVHWDLVSLELFIPSRGSAWSAWNFLTSAWNRSGSLLGQLGAFSFAVDSPLQLIAVNKSNKFSITFQSETVQKPCFTYHFFHDGPTFW